MSKKLQGTVKWFSNKKGYGFITPAADDDDENSTNEDIFVHQSVIHCEGYRTLDEGWAVEFSVGRDEDGKIKAEDVTAPGGGPCTGPRSTRRPRREGRREEPVVEKEEPAAAVVGDDAPTVDSKKGPPRRARRNNNRREKSNNGERLPAQPFWHEILSSDVKSALDARGIRTSTGTIDVAYGPARVKLGTRGYSSMAHADAILCEGLFSCTPSGEVTFQWKNAIKFDDGEWKSITDTTTLLSKLSLKDDSVAAVGREETAVSLWGNGPTDPKHALEEFGFEMRRVVLTAKNR